MSKIKQFVEEIQSHLRSCQFEVFYNHEYEIEDIAMFSFSDGLERVIVKFKDGNFEVLDNTELTKFKICKMVEFI